MNWKVQITPNRTQIYVTSITGVVICQMRPGQALEDQDVLDAAKIAAAPELYEALDKVLCDTAWHAMSPESLALARAALYKADHVMRLRAKQPDVVPAPTGPDVAADPMPANPPRPIKHQVCRRISAGLTAVIYSDLSYSEAATRCQSLNDEAGNHIPEHFVRIQGRRQKGNRS